MALRRTLLRPVLVLTVVARSAGTYGGARYGGGRGGYGGASRGRGSRGRGRSAPVYRPAFDDMTEGSSESGEMQPDEQLDQLYGVSPVLSALRSRRRELRRLWLQDTLSTDKRSDRPALREIETLAHEAGLPVGRRDKGTLNGMCRNRPHQGLVLEAEPLSYVPLEALPPLAEASDPAPAPLWLALDEVTDPQNLGALLRSALFLGVDGVLVSAKNTCSLTPSVSKASAGAMELSPVHSARNLPRTLEAAREAGWQIVGAALERSIEPSELDQSVPTVLVLGSEGAGLRTNVLRACSSLVRIPRGATALDDAELVDSLNVSVAGGILLYTLMSQRRAST